ncbi:iron chaperone [Zongyangia hominis]|uniref:Iron chaperone n=1 Tax=Zongyangia hominis TaxID=2763677 RepID=A0A926IB09_9FIRM|nr:iron chaperone [Zongyangia hominis]MBC8570751.1 iron chaperone [Zongyangia hominis]
MGVFAEYLAQIENSKCRDRTAEVLDWVGLTFPDLEPRIAWNQPMFTDHGTFIIGFSVSAKHLAVSPERAGMEHFRQEITQAGYGQSKMLFRIPWDKEVDYPLLHRIIVCNRVEKADCKTFWRNSI